MAVSHKPNQSIEDRKKREKKLDQNELFDVRSEALAEKKDKRKLSLKTKYWAA